jgi:hypothetical protein
LFVLYVTELVVEVPPLPLGMLVFGSKGALVSAPEIPNSWQIVATLPELKMKVMLSADRIDEAMA